MQASNDTKYQAPVSHIVSSAFSQLVRARELSLKPPAEHARISEQLADAILRPLLGEQLTECVADFAQMASPTGSRIVSLSGLDPLLAYHVFEAIPVLPADRARAEELACNEFRRMAAQPELAIPGAELNLYLNGEVTVRPVLGMRSFK